MVNRTWKHSVAYSLIFAASAIGLRLRLWRADLTQMEWALTFWWFYLVLLVLIGVAVWLLRYGK